jgi:hypothetical protein
MSDILPLRAMPGPRKRLGLRAGILGSIGVASLLGGCASQRLVLPPSPTAGLSVEEAKAMTARAETPAGLSTVQFKELGDTKRFATMSALIRKTWGEECKPTSAMPAGYQPSGASSWRVHCQGSVIAYDYLVGLPERADGNARVLPCYKPNPRQITCSIAGRPGQ